MTWASLFERAATFDADEERVRDALVTRRASGDPDEMESDEGDEEDERDA